MIVGPVTIRWTKDIKAEQARRAKAKRLSVAVTEALLHDNTRYKALLRQHGLSKVLIDAQAGKDSKPPRGAGHVV